MTPLTMHTTTTIAVVGASGRMGRAVIDAALDPSLCCRTALELDAKTPDSQAVGVIDCVIDFSSARGAIRAAQLATERGAALLSCTTGLDDQARSAVLAAAKKICVMVAPNTSLGVAVARRLCRDAARLLGSEYAVDLIEHHHHRKLDAPSGTALALAEAVRAGSGIPVPLSRIHSIRAGDTIGAHSVQFTGPFESIRIEHDAVSRQLFAIGALRLARWLHGRPAGLVTIDDWLDDRLAHHPGAAS
ncbi:MAG: 4-hydroxy-tetrahydrodipicolinate reductase [Phycisphaerae bacterium]|nr:4-hydroxy-tetrahydrodipicolinate reductase [Phycisphaerae bacterium]